MRTLKQNCIVLAVCAALIVIGIASAQDSKPSDPIAQYLTAEMQRQHIPGVQLASRKYAGDVDPAEITAGDRIHAGIPWMSCSANPNTRGTRLNLVM